MIIFNVLEVKHELNFDFEHRPYLFVDKETNEQIKLNPVEYKAIYLEKMSQFRKEFEIKCSQYKI